MFKEADKAADKAMDFMVKGYHACDFTVEIGEEFVATRKRGECGNTFKVFNQHGQLGHLKTELVSPLWPLIKDAT